MYGQSRKGADYPIKTRFDFYTHLAVFVVLITFFAVLNYLAFSGTYWFIWILVFWGLAVALHGATALTSARKNEALKTLRKEESDSNLKTNGRKDSH